MHLFKKTGRRIVAVLLVLTLAMEITASWAGAAPKDGLVLDEHDQAKLYAFWQQEAYDGMNNGEAVYDIRLGEGGYLSVPRPEYDGTCITHLVHTAVIPGYGVGIDDFGFYYDLPGWSGAPTPEHYAQPRFSPLVSVYPDLYGPLDLQATSVGYFGSPVADQTHISSVNLNDCPNLYFLEFSGQNHCSDVTALNCPRLNYIRILGGEYKSIAFNHIFVEQPVEVSAFGNGSVGAWYQADNGSITHASVFAYPNGDSFVGWFSEGEPVSTDLEYYNEYGGKLTACFGGDADGNGSIDLADAVSVMQFAMLREGGSGNEAMMDVNGNGMVDISDAACILRFTLGV